MSTVGNVAEAVQTDSLLVDAKEAAALCGVSVSGWYNLVACGKMPRSVKLGRLVKWRRDELERWCAAYCPARSRWDEMTAAGNNHKHRA